jgi:hypothetical protein
MICSSDLTWQGPHLYLGRKRVAVVVQDENYTSMWRVVRSNGTLSDMCNFTRARDAAMAMVLSDLNRREKPAEAGYSDLNDKRVAA